MCKCAGVQVHCRYMYMQIPISLERDRREISHEGLNGTAVLLDLELDSKPIIIQTGPVVGAGKTFDG